MFVTETFHKADLARVHAGRETLNVKDIRFSRFMTPDSLWVVPAERVWEQDFFSSNGNSASGASQGKGGRVIRFHDIDKIQKKIKDDMKKKKQKKQQQQQESVKQEEEDTSPAAAPSEEEDDEQQEEHPEEGCATQE